MITCATTNSRRYAARFVSLLCRTAGIKLHLALAPLTQVTGCESRDNPQNQDVVYASAIGVQNGALSPSLKY